MLPRLPCLPLQRVDVDAQILSICFVDRDHARLRRGGRHRSLSIPPHRCEHIGAARRCRRGRALTVVGALVRVLLESTSTEQAVCPSAVRRACRTRRSLQSSLAADASKDARVTRRPGRNASHERDRRRARSLPAYHAAWSICCASCSLPRAPASAPIRAGMTSAWVVAESGTHERGLSTVLAVGSRVAADRILATVDRRITELTRVRMEMRRTLRERRRISRVAPDRCDGRFDRSASPPSSRLTPRSAIPRVPPLAYKLHFCIPRGRVRRRNDGRPAACRQDRS